MAGRRRWSLAVLAAAAVTSGVVGFGPIGSTSSCTVNSDGGAPVCTTGRTSLIATEGPSVLIVLAVPVAIAALAVVFPTRRVARAVAIVLTASLVIAAMSIGVFFLPTVVMAWAATSRGREAP